MCRPSDPLVIGLSGVTKGAEGSGGSRVACAGGQGLFPEGAMFMRKYCN